MIRDAYSKKLRALQRPKLVLPEWPAVRARATCAEAGATGEGSVRTLLVVAVLAVSLGALSLQGCGGGGGGQDGGQDGGACLGDPEVNAWNGAPPATLSATGLYQDLGTPDRGGRRPRLHAQLPAVVGTARRRRAG